ncbi:hypothetical protein B566_EDAN005079 [Ephemera danica]|nr:hypothetical protein B566_EDAN005079 [Ephemera danica]
MKETAMQAKSLLDGRQLDGCTLCCDWLDSNHVTFESLHSKCLYVDRLPPNFRDMGEFRKVFSSIVNPPYCQIALKNGCPQDWGLVEFSCAEDAELSRSAVDNVQLRGHSFRTAFYIPGVRAINLYLKLLNDSGNKSKGALLPDPPAPAVFQQLQNLAKQNPIFAQNLQNIILSQIQNLPQKSEPSVKTTVSPNSCASSVSSLSSTSSTSSVTSINIPPPPPLPRKAPQIIVPPPASCATSTGKPSPTPNGSGNSQAALVVLLAAQMQMQMGNSPPSLLGNPQMLASLQNLLKQGSNSPFPPNHFQQGQSSIIPNHDKLQPNKNGMNGMKNGYHKSASLPKVPLLPSPPTGVSPPPREVSPLEGHISVSPSEAANAAAISNLWSGLLGGQIMPNLSPQTMEQLLTSKPTLQDKMGYPGKPAELYAPLPQGPTDLQQHLGMLLSNPHNLNALLGTLVPPAFLAPQQQRQAPPTAEAAWGLPPSPPPPPAAWVPPMGSPLRPWAPGSFPTPSTSPIVFAGCPGLWATTSHAPVTPVGQKRKYNHILPSPEPSPEGNYIGQHSQGLGGHYADSYFKRKKKH